MFGFELVISDVRVSIKKYLKRRMEYMIRSGIVNNIILLDAKIHLTIEIDIEIKVNSLFLKILLIFLIRKYHRVP